MVEVIEFIVFTLIGAMVLGVAGVLLYVAIGMSYAFGCALVTRLDTNGKGKK